MKKLYSVMIILMMVFLSGCAPEGEPSTDPVIVNNSPVIYAPFTTTIAYTQGARVDYDLRYREHGCSSSGSPTGVSGAKDPDGDTLQYRISCKWSVFDASYEKINNEWVTFPVDDRGEQKAIVTLFIGYTADVKPYPYQPKCVSTVVESVPFTYEVRDGNGGTASYSIMLGSD